MARESIWTGSLTFGLVNIPVVLRPAEARKELGFSLRDKSDMSPIGYRKVNKTTGQEVPKDRIVKAFEYADDRWVVVDDADFKKAAPERTKAVEITAFVDAKDIDPAYFDRPYYLEPARRGEKPYLLLLEALTRAGKAGIAQVVLRNRAYLSAVIPRGDVLMLELLRYDHELRPPRGLGLSAADKRKWKVTEGELKMAQRLIDDLAAPWRPEEYRDEYTDQLLQFIKTKAEKGETAAAPAEAGRPERLEPPADIMALLKRSVAHAESGKSHPRGDGRAPHGRRGRMLH